MDLLPHSSSPTCEFLPVGRRHVNFPGTPKQSNPFDEWLVRSRVVVKSTVSMGFNGDTQLVESVSP